MTKSHILATAAVALAFAASAASAASLQGPKLDTQRQATAQEAGSQTDIAPSAIALTAGADSSKVTVSGSVSWDDIGDRYGFTSLSLKLSAPLDDDDDNQSDVFSVDGQISGMSGEVTFTRTFLTERFRSPHTPRSLDLLDKGRKGCREDPRHKLSPDACDSATYRQVEEFLTEEERKLHADEAFYQAKVWNVGASGALGYDEHEYRDALTLEEASTERTPFSVKAFFGQVGPAKSFGLASGGYVSWRLGAKYEQDYKDATKRTLCKPAPATGPQECFTGPFAKPDRELTSSAYGVLRLIPTASESLVGFKGLEANSDYDFENDVFSIGGSLYLIADDKGQARGGVRARWKTNDDDPLTKDDNFTFGVFVGVPLGF